MTEQTSDPLADVIAAHHWSNGSACGDECDWLPDESSPDLLAVQHAAHVAAVVRASGAGLGGINRERGEAARAALDRLLDHLPAVAAQDWQRVADALADPAPDDRCQDRTRTPRGMLRCTLPAGHDADPLSLHTLDPSGPADPAPDDTTEVLVDVIHRERCRSACPPHPVDHGIASAALAWFRWNQHQLIPAPDDTTDLREVDQGTIAAFREKWFHAMAERDAARADLAALREPRVVTTADQLDALPACTVIRTNAGQVRERWHDGLWRTPGVTLPQPVGRSTFPVTVVWTPPQQDPAGA